MPRRLWRSVRAIPDTDFSQKGRRRRRSTGANLFRHVDLDSIQHRPDDCDPPEKLVDLKSERKDVDGRDAPGTKCAGAVMTEAARNYLYVEPGAEAGAGL